MRRDAPWPAPAKINRFLHIVGRRTDGYHDLQTVFQFLDFGDALRFHVRADGAISRTGGALDVASENDLAVRAARALQQAAGTGLGAAIHIEKRIPQGGGLGGGSSDAATTLVALNSLWRTGLSETALLALAGELGADVPVFVAGRAAFAEGRGERLSPVQIDEPWFLVVDPGVSVSTAEMYADPRLRRDCPPVTLQDFAAGACGNVFEPLVLEDQTPVREAHAWLSNHAPARMSGSGACLFAGFESSEQAHDLLAALPSPWRGFVARGRNESPLLGRLRAGED